MRYLGTLLGCALWVSALNLPCAAADNPPNVLLIMSDDLAAGSLGCYGNQVCQTPHIDGLADQGVRYSRAFCQFPVCEPSRASMMSGYYPHGSGTMGYVSGRKQIGPDRAMWPEHFRNAGYHTARVSKMFHMGVPGGIEKGDNGTDDEACWVERYNSQGPEVFTAGFQELLEGNPDGTKKVKGGNTLEYVMADGDDLVHSDGKTAAKACELLGERAAAGDPFWLGVGFVRPHVPFAAPTSYYEPYPPEEIELPEWREDDWDDIPKAGINYRTSVNMNLNREQERRGIAAYYASVSFMDAQVGKVLTALRDEGLEDNTIVIFTSDHGFHLCEHRFWMKVGMMDESSQVPLIIRAPGKAPGVSDAFVELLDLYPTTSEMCGLEVPERLQGKSLVGTLDDPAGAAVRDHVFCTNRGSFLIRTDRWAFIQHGENGNGGMQLYDMEEDPLQFESLSDNPEYAHVVAEYQERLAAKLEEVRDCDIRN